MVTMGVHMQECLSEYIKASAWNMSFPRLQQAHKGALVADIGRCMGLTVMYTCEGHYAGRLQITFGFVASVYNGPFTIASNQAPW